jgi:endonuclease/exonuclease/phosphatase (EEP) superfamily protein YafD
MQVRAPIRMPASHSRRRRRRRLSNWVAVPLWIVVVLLGVVVIMRLVAWDDFEPFAVLNTVTAFVYLPAWIVLLVAVLGRRPFLAGAALLIVVAQIAFLFPELTAAEPVPTWATHAPTLRLLDANVYNVNPSMAGYASEISAVRPQLVTMEEATPVDVSQLDRSGALADLPYRFEIKRFDPAAFFVASHYPLSHTKVVHLYGRPLIIQTTLELPSGPQRLWVVHTIAPLPSSFSQWKGQLTTIGRLLRARGPGGLLIVGDFNATWGSRGFRSILDSGVTDGAAARGKPFEMTWSQIKPLLPPLVRIDHVLTGPGVAVTQIRTDVGPGSDHRDLIATVAIRRSFIRAGLRRPPQIDPFSGAGHTERADP